jgi:hypothetical protein
MLILLATSMFNLAFNIEPTKEAISANATSQNNVAPASSTAILSGNQTWYGDFTVNAGETVIIENSNFTVENGQIYVYGTLQVENSTIWMRHVNTKTKVIWVYGNFTMSNSTILGSNSIRAWTNSNVIIINSSSPTTKVGIWGADVRINNSIILNIVINEGNLQFVNSELIYGILLRGGTSYILNSIITVQIYITLEGCRTNLEFRTGLVENLVVLGESTSSPFEPANFTFVNSYVASWIIDAYGFEGMILNSVVETLYFFLDPVWSGNLTFPEYIAYSELDYASSPFIIENSTVKEFGLTIFGENQIRISNSNVYVDIGTNSYPPPNQRISILNSNVLGLNTQTSLSSTVLVTNSSIMYNQIYFVPPPTSLNLALKDGLNEFFNLSIEETGYNMTLVNSNVNQWGILVIGGFLNLSDSTLTHSYYDGYDNVNFVAGTCYIANSTVESIYSPGMSGGNLTLANSTVNVLSAYSSTQVTAINSTIKTLITDPIQVRLVNSTIALELDFSFEMTSEESITASFSEEYDPPLPEGVLRFSQYVDITTAYNDYFESQVKIFYNETQVEEAKIDETRLKIYYLNDSDIWQLCSIQGVNTIENYVWSNVTHFSCFVLGVDSKLGDLNFDGVINYKDASLFRLAYIGAYNYLADFNQDEVINYKDASLFRTYYIAG